MEVARKLAAGRRMSDTGGGAGAAARGGCSAAARAALALLLALLPAPAGGSAAEEQEDFGALVAGLDSATAAARAAAARDLSELGDPRAVQPLARRLAAEADSGVAAEIIRALARLADRRALPPLVDFVSASGDAKARTTACFAIAAIDAKTARIMLLQRFGTEKKGIARERLLEALMCVLPPDQAPAAAARIAASDPYAVVRRNAVEFLAAHPGASEAEKILISSLGAGSQDRRAYAAWALGRLETAAAAGALAKALVQAEGQAAAEAAFALGSAGEPPAAPLIHLWQRSPGNAVLRAAAAHALGASKDRKAVQVLAAGLSDSDWLVRFASSGSLALAGSKEAAEAAYEAARAEGPGLRITTMDALARLDDPRAFDLLAARLPSLSGRAAVACLCAAAAKPSPARIGLLRKAASSARAEDRAAAARLAGYHGLAPMSDAIALLFDDSVLDVRMEAAKAAGWIASAGLLAPLMKTASDPKCPPILAAACIEACGKIFENDPGAPSSAGADAALQAMLKGLSNGTPAVRSASIRALESQRRPEAVDGLLRHAGEEKDPLLRRAAFEALARITGLEAGENLEAWTKWWETGKEGFKAGGGPAPSGVSRPAFAAYLDDLRRRGMDVAFVFDVTGSMGSELETAQRKMSAVLGVLSGLVPSLRAGFVAYRDEVVSERPLTFDHESVVFGMEPLQAFGGDPDWEEAVETALEAVVGGWDFREHARKVVIIIGDAPPRRPDRAVAIARIAHRRLGMTFFCAAAHTGDPADLKALAEIAVNGGGSIVPLSGPDRLSGLLVEFALGQAWSDEARMASQGR